MIKASSFTIPGTSGFSITGVGFKPRWLIILGSNKSVQDSWISGSLSAGIGAHALNNSVVDTTNYRLWSYTEQWDHSATVDGLGNDHFVGYVRAGELSLWAKEHTESVDGFAMYLTSFDADGFTFAFSGGFTAGATGSRIYYLAGDESYEEVATAVFPSSDTVSLGWEPQAFFGIGGGSQNPTPTYPYNYGATDASLPTVLAGDWGEYTTEGLGINSVYRGIVDPTVDIQHWYGKTSAGSQTTILERTISAGVIYSDVLSFSRTATSFSGSIVPDSFGSGAAWMGTFMLGSVDSIIGEFMPSTTVGVPTQVDLPFTPEAVVFFSPQEDRAGIGGQAVQGATGWGWCTETDQALLIYGGHWNPLNTRQSAMFMSSSNCWVGNCLDRDTMGSVGTEVNMGSAQVNPSGFTHTTTAHSADPGEVWPVLYWAFAPVSDQPQFFRRV